ncbi:hypothetical protein, partial [Halorubrum sp. Atlit-28R]|uniref:hypothetical protein n=1 Tax=Halorubrum sp. Atlit-28R TaxID=2282129 RepID=UPI0011C38E61
MSSTGSPNPDDPIKWMIENYYTHKSESSYENALDACYHGKVAFVPWLEENGLSPREANEDVIRDYFESLKTEYKP